MLLRGTAPKAVVSPTKPGAATDAAAQSPTSSEDSSTEEEPLPGCTGLAAAEAAAAQTPQESLVGPWLAVGEGDAGRVTREIRELSRTGFPASGCDSLICLERAWLQLRPSKDKLPEVKLCDPAGLKAKEEEEVANLFALVSAFRRRSVELATELKPFIPDFIPAIGEVPNSLEPPRPCLGQLEADAPPTRQSRRNRCQNTALLRWLRARARRRALQKVRLISTQKQEPGLASPAAKKTRQRDALAKWLTRPSGRRALGRLQRRGGGEALRTPAAVVVSGGAGQQESSDGASWATAIEGGGYASHVGGSCRRSQ